MRSVRNVHSEHKHTAPTISGAIIMVYYMGMVANINVVSTVESKPVISAVIEAVNKTGTNSRPACHILTC